MGLVKKAASLQEYGVRAKSVITTLSRIIIAIVLNVLSFW